MLGFTAACLFMLQPLAATGGNDGIWFVGDLDPSVINFDVTTKGFDYALCMRGTKNEYVNLKRLSHRPIAIERFKDTVWFVDYTSSVALYAVEKQSDGTNELALQGIMESDSAPTDLIASNDKLYICFGNTSLQLFTFVNGVFEQLPSLNVKNARVADSGGFLMAAAPAENGASVWKFVGDQWVGGDIVRLQGDFVALETKEDWPLFISIENQQCNIVGLQQSKGIQISSFEIPRGRWSLLPAPTGLCVMGVERNGTVTAVDIGWPSGRLSDPIKLQIGSGAVPSIFSRFEVLFTIVLISIFLGLNFWVQKSKKTKKEGSEE
jgi:hypothetical protein